MTRSCWRCSINPASGPCPRASDASPAARRRSRLAARRVAGARDHRLDDPNSVGTGVGGGRGRGADGIGRPRGTRGGGRGVRRRDLPGTRGAGRRGRSGPRFAPLGPHRDSGGRSELAASRGTHIVLTNSAGVHAEPIADWVIAAIAYFARGLDRLREFQAAGRWAWAEFADFAVPVRELSELRLGVFGLGGIGGAIARRGVA